MSHDATPLTFRNQVISALQSIVGLSLTAAGRAADMRMFDFGELYRDGGDSGCLFAFHVQCSWRIEGPHGIVTGRSDLWEPAEVNPDPRFANDDWDYQKSPNLQDLQLDHWMAQYASSLAVETVNADEFGGVAITFGQCFVLRLFPAGTRGEDWRLFRPKTGASHFVVSAGAIESDPE